VFETEVEYRRQLAAFVDLEPGDYTVCTHFSHGPAVPYRLSASASPSVIMTLSRGEDDPDVHGVTTRGLQRQAPVATFSDLHESFEVKSDTNSASVGARTPSVSTRRHNIPASIINAFNAADILQHQKLDLRGVRRGLIEYVMSHTTIGSQFNEAMHKLGSQDGGEAFDLVAFADIVRRSLENTSVHVD
jgi:hypothetical protein